MPVTDSMFLILESREHPFHVGSLQLFQPPPEAGPDYPQVFYEQLMATTEVAVDFRKRTGQHLSVMGPLRWIVDDAVNFEYHVRRLALPSPARVRELLALTSRLHSQPLDRHKPLWEMAIIEGLVDRRLAVYTKVHHSVTDGVGALRTLMRALTDDSEARDCPAVWAPDTRRRANGSGTGPALSLANPIALPRAARDAARSMAEVVPGIARYGTQLLRKPELVRPLQAPRTMLNVPIGGARRFAAQSWSLPRVKTLGKALDGTVNDVVLAMCSGALRAYLSDRGGLPDKPLISMCPVSIRSDQDNSGGNSLTAILANMATDKADPLARFDTIVASVRSAKAMLADMTPVQRIAAGLMNAAPAGAGALPWAAERATPAFNVVISNVPGPRTAMYWNGAELVGAYPASIPMDGQALNITVTSTADMLHFGLTGCRTSMPHLQRILTHLEDSLAELEAAAGV